MNHPTPPQNKWHVDKTINLAVVVGLLGIIGTGMVAIGSGIWFASGVTTRLSMVEDRQKIAEPLAGQIIELKTKVDAIDHNVTEIRAWLRPAQQDQRR